MGGQSPLDLLTPDPLSQPSFLSNKWTQFSCALSGFSLVCFINLFTKRPIFSGIQKHIAATAIGAVAGNFVEERRLNYLAERDAVLRNYIELHPDDFPTPERKKYAELLLPWIPIR